MNGFKDDAEKVIELGKKGARPQSIGSMGMTALYVAKEKTRIQLERGEAEVASEEYKEELLAKNALAELIDSLRRERAFTPEFISRMFED